MPFMVTIFEMEISLGSKIAIFSISSNKVLNQVIEKLMCL